MLTYAFKFQYRNGIKRISTDKVKITENVSGVELGFNYYPSVISFSPFNFNLGFEKDSEIPNASLVISDADRDFHALFDSTNPESIVVDVYQILDKEVIKQFKAVPSDLRWANGQVTVDIRIPEEFLEKDFMDYFKPVTFQYIASPTIRNAFVSPQWELGPELPWQIIGADYRRTYVFKPTLATGLGYDPLIGDPFFITARRVDGLSLVGSHPHIKLKNMFRGYFYYAEDDIVEPNPPSDPYLAYSESGRAYTSGGGGTYILTDLDTTCLFKNTTSYYYDFVNNRFLQNFDTYTAGDLVGAGSTVPLVWDDAGTLRSLLQKSSTAGDIMDYQMAQLGSSFMPNAEVIKYLVAGAGAIDFNTQDNIWIWYSTGTPSLTDITVSESRALYLSGIPTVDINFVGGPLFEADPRSAHRVYPGTNPDLTPEPGWPLYDSQVNFATKFSHGSYAMIQHIDDETSLYSAQNDFISAGLEIPNFFRCFDRVFVKANGFIPDPSDPVFSTGYMWTGQKTISKVTGAEYKILNRFHVKSVFTGIDLRTIVDPDFQSIVEEGNFEEEVVYLELYIHNLKFAPNHIYSVISMPEAMGEFPDVLQPLSESGKEEIIIAPHRNELELVVDADSLESINLSKSTIEQQKLEYYDFKYLVSMLEIYIDNISEDDRLAISADTDEGKIIRESLKDRFRGLIVDMSKDFQGLESEISRSIYGTDSQSASDENINILNNNNGRFGICTGSEILVDIDGYDRLVERLYFHVGGPTAGGIPIPNLATTTISPFDYIESKRKNKVFTNYLYYKPTIDLYNASEITDYTQRTLSLDEAKGFFLSGRYRIINDPVPENSDDLGRYFPIIYGLVKRIPALHVVSKKSLFETTQETAGDDIYIYSSHPCSVETPNDLVIEFFDDSIKEIPKTSEEESNLATKTYFGSVAKSPFPAFEDDHIEYKVINGNETYRYATRLNNPYHDLIVKETLDGKPMFGFKLRGAEWKSEIGRSDKRYPIRNGFGKTVLYVTLFGHKDIDGRLTGKTGKAIEHPLDCALHYVRTYGKSPYNFSIVNEESFQKTKSRTIDYKASIFLDEKMTIPSFIKEISRQFCLFSHFHNGLLSFTDINLDVVNYKYYLKEGVNIIHDPIEEPIPYNAVYNEVIYNYDFNYPADRFNKKIHLNASNNSDLAKASKNLQNKSIYEIDAKFCSDEVTAQKVARKIAKLFSNPRRYYALSVKDDVFVNYPIGEQVPVTFSPLGLNNTPCLIVSKKELEDGTVELVILKILND